MSTKVCCYINSQNVFEKFLAINYQKAHVSLEKKGEYIEILSIHSKVFLRFRHVLTVADLF